MKPSRFNAVALALAIAAAAGVYLAGGWSVSLWDRDEAWYARASRQMVQSGDWLVPRFLDDIRYAKPIFIYWCQAASMKLIGQTPFAARLPSAVAMTLTLILLATVFTRAVSGRVALHIVLIFSSSAMVIASAKMCLTDSVLLFFLTIAQLCLFKLYDDQHQTAPGRSIRPAVVFFWIAVGLAGLTKGPIVLLILGATLAALALFDRGGLSGKCSIAWWRSTRPLQGLFIVAAIVLPWLIASYLRQPEFVTNLLAEPVRHASSNQDGHLIYPGYHLAAIWLTFFPWSIFLPFILIYAWRQRGRPEIRFALATIIGTFIVAELMVTKLPHYTLPAFTSLAFLLADMNRLTGVPPVSVDPVAGSGRPIFMLIPWTLGTIALALLPTLAGRWFNIPKPPATLFAIAGIAYALTVAALLLTHRMRALILTMAGGMLLCISILYLLYLPSAQFLRLPQRVAERLKAENALKPGDVVMIGYNEPSLAFYTDGIIRPRPAGFLQSTPPDSWPQWIVIPQTQLDKLPDPLRRRLVPIASFRGLSYNDPPGPIELLILRTTPPN